jgi:hypothetical protein
MITIIIISIVSPLSFIGFFISFKSILKAKNKQSVFVITDKIFAGIIMMPVYTMIYVLSAVIYAAQRLHSEVTSLDSFSHSMRGSFYDK